MAYLTGEVRHRPSFTIGAETDADRVVIEHGAAAGVLTAGGHRYAAGEVVVSAGTFGSAALLLRSGIGPAAQLRRHGIEVVADLPVGLRFQDHPRYLWPPCSLVSSPQVTTSGMTRPCSASFVNNSSNTTTRRRLLP